MNFPNTFFIFIHSVAFMSVAVEFVWSQTWIDQLVSNAGWSALTDVNSVPYQGDRYGVNDLTAGIVEDDKVRANVAMLLLGCSYASTLRTVLFGYGKIMDSCLKKHKDDEKFNEYTVDILRSLVNFDGLLDRMEKALIDVDEYRGRYEPPVINLDPEDDYYEGADYVFGNAIEQIRTWAYSNVSLDDPSRSNREANFHLLDIFLYTLDDVKSGLEHAIGNVKCGLSDPQYAHTLKTWTRNFQKKPQHDDNIFFKHLIGEVEAVISTASITKYDDLGFVETTLKI